MPEERCDASGVKTKQVEGSSGLAWRLYWMWGGDGEGGVGNTRCVKQMRGELRYC